MRTERKSQVLVPANHPRPAADSVRSGSARAVILVFCVGLALEATLPWVMIWLSDLFVFDTPDWSRWLVFGAPAVLSVLALVVYKALGARSGQLCPASMTTRQSRWRARGRVDAAH